MVRFKFKKTNNHCIKKKELGGTPNYKLTIS